MPGGAFGTLLSAAAAAAAAAMVFSRPGPGVPSVNLAQEGAFDGDPGLHRAAKRPRPSLRPHTAPEVVRARESASKKPPVKPFPAFFQQPAAGAASSQ